MELVHLSSICLESLSQTLLSWHSRLLQLLTLIGDFRGTHHSPTLDWDLKYEVDGQASQCFSDKPDRNTRGIFQIINKNLAISSFKDSHLINCRSILEPVQDEYIGNIQSAQIDQSQQSLGSTLVSNRKSEVSLEDRTINLLLNLNKRETSSL